jgi:hypothetical protein
MESVGEEEVLETGKVGRKSEVKDWSGEKGVLFIDDR